MATPVTTDPVGRHPPAAGFPLAFPSIDEYASDAMSDAPEYARSSYDAVIIGSGPNGLAAAITLAQVGKSVLVIEGRDTIGGGMRSAELTLPGFVHDICSAVHPLAVSSPFFRALPLEEHGLSFIQPDAPLAHPLPRGDVATLERSITFTAQPLGYDASAYKDLVEPFVEHWQDLYEDLLAPAHIPRHPLLMAQFGLKAIRSAETLATKTFRNARARALFAGNAAHAVQPLENRMTSAVGLMLHVSAHATGWPIARGGSQSIADAMGSYLRSRGGEIVTGQMIKHWRDLPQAKAYLFDTAPQALARIAHDQLPERFLHRLRKYRFGMGAFKVDFALSQPIPWESPECRRAGTVHVGGTFEEIAASERAAWHGPPSSSPFVLVAQQSLFDPTRAPVGQHTAWAYCHVPNASTMDMTSAIEGQIARFAPGFRDTILARATMTTHQLEQYNPNYVGGDITGGVQDLTQTFTRPTVRLNPYTTPNPKIFICSASTPPGGGVHGMCGYWAARAALTRAIEAPKK